MLHNVHTLGINTKRHFDDVAIFLAEPLNFPIQATRLSERLTPVTQGSDVAPDEWATKAVPNSDEDGVFVRSNPPNIFGITGHWVRLPDGSTICVPLRVMRNGAGTAVSLTLSQQPNMDGVQFNVDTEWVQRDLVRLRMVLKAEQPLRSFPCAMLVTLFADQAHRRIQRVQRVMGRPAYPISSPGSPRTHRGAPSPRPASR